ncbi:ATPase, T2SS/T4P/T4SS family [Neorhodopirellula pilleata]|uniref:Putative conjugal transfer protein n=1 Tax=Neorhodopirellula pilleata TaxID=2714738 RepID=A0A5C6AXD3_9BACT|nr:ATPase, T2SS/T4P/T4SS family [Neorhodopirellula pilleata]TWU03702.1 putative conjugal transfer protein [Neorhodopirellula pilleata]
MRIAFNRLGDASPTYFNSTESIIRIGSNPSLNDIVLSNPYVSPTHAILNRNGDTWELTPLGDNEIIVGQSAVRMGERAIIGHSESIEIFPFTLKIENAVDFAGDDASLDDQISRLVLTIHRDLLARLDVEDADDSRKQSDAFLLQLEHDIEELARTHGFESPESESVVMHSAAMQTQGALLRRLIEGRHDEVKSNELWTRMLTSMPDMERTLDEWIAEIESELSVQKSADLSERIAQIERRFHDRWNLLCGKRKITGRSDFLRYLAHAYVKKQVKDILFGYGPLEDLIRMPNISEIMVVSRDKIYVEKNGVLEKSGRRFVSDDVTVAIIERIVNRVGRRINTAEPLVDARLLDGSRVNAVIAPLAISGPCLTIRKFPSKKMLIDDLVRKGALSRVARNFLQACVLKGCNILISGGTGTGKTTMLNCLSDFIPDKERIITIEDTAELQLQKQHVVRMETKSANLEGTGEYTIRDLVKNSLRMRPDRIVVGECRGPEALDMLQAMNTGHDGSMTTIHANTAEDVIQRLEVLVQTAADLPISSIHSQIGSAIDIVVQLSRLNNGRRCVSQITEFVGYDKSEQVLRTKDLFLLDDETDDAELMPTGALPSFMSELLARELIDLDAFYR